MDFAMTKWTIKNAPARKSIMLEGIHGLGKSQCVFQCAKELSVETGKPHIVIDIRLAQREAGDILGYPRGIEKQVSTFTAFNEKGEKTTIKTEARCMMVHDLPIWFPVDPDLVGFLFFDELHYAPKDVLNSIFELALDYRLNMVNLPAGIRVIAAGNHNQDIYGGTTINPALYSRWLKVEFKPTVPEWMAYAKAEKIHPSIIQYIQSFDKDLDPPENVEPGTIVPDRRSWFSLSEFLYSMAGKEHDPMKELDYLLLLSKGYVGSAVATNFMDFVKNKFRVITPGEVLNKLDDALVQEIKDSSPEAITNLSNEIASFVAQSKKALKPKASKNMAIFLQTALPKEAASGFWTALLTECQKEGCRQVALEWYEKESGPQGMVKDFIYGRLNKKEAMK